MGTGNRLGRFGVDGNIGMPIFLKPRSHLIGFQILNTLIATTEVIGLAGHMLPPQRKLYALSWMLRIFQLFTESSPASQLSKRGSSHVQHLRMLTWNRRCKRERASRTLGIIETEVRGGRLSNSGVTWFARSAFPAVEACIPFRLVNTSVSIPEHSIH